MKQKIALIIAIIAGIAAFWLTGEYLRHERDKIRGGAKRILVVAAANDLPAGSMLKFGDLGQVWVDQGAVGGRAVLPEAVGEIYGKKLLFSIKKLDPIRWSDIDAPYKLEGGLAEMINPPMRAISISVDAVASVSGMVKPNDHVDVLGTFMFPSATITGEVESVTLTVLQDVTVLATGQTLAKKTGAEEKTARAGAGYSTVTFEVTLREAELLVFAQSMKGRLYLALRNPTDVSYVADLPSINFDYLHRKLQEMNLFRQRDIRHKKDLQ